MNLINLQIKYDINDYKYNSYSTKLLPLLRLCQDLQNFTSISYESLMCDFVVSKQKYNLIFVKLLNMIKM